MLKPSLIMRWMRPANCVGSSKEKPDVNKDVSNRSQMRSFTVLSDLSAEAFFLSSVMMEWFGFTSMVFFDTMYELMELSRRACAFMMRSMFADQPCSEVTRTTGESAMRVPIRTFSTLSPRTSLMSLQSGSNSALASSVFFFSSSVSKSRPSFVTDLSFLLSYSLSCCTQYSSIGSHVEHLDSLLLKGLNERRARDTLDALAGDVVDVVLALLHAVAVLLQADHLVTGLGSLEAEEVRQLRAVRRVLVDTELQVLRELLVELLVVILLLRDLREHL